MSSVFSESKITLLKSNESIISCAVSNTINATIAVATNIGVHFFSESGEIETACYQLEGTTVLKWHPTLPLLAIGSKTGAITIWSDESKHPKETFKAHGSPVSCISYHSNGRRLVSGDESGKSCIFKDSVLRCSFDKGSKISHMCFADLVVNDDGRSITYPLFFFGNTSGLVCLADENTHCRDMCKVSGSIKVLTYFEKTGSVIVISSNLLVLEFKLSLSDKLVPEKKMKLSIAGSPEELMSHWVHDNILVLCSKENVLRLWHVEADENYILTSSDFSSFGPVVNDKIVASTYSSPGKVLCAGSANGKIFFWKNMVPKIGPKEREQWKPLLPISLNSEMISLHSSERNNVMVARSENYVSLILETFIKGRLNDQVNLLQISGRKVFFSISNEITNSEFMYESENHIKCVDANNKNFVCFTSKEVEVHEYEITPDSSQLKQMHSFPSPSSFTCVLHGENIILAQSKMLAVANFSGVVKQSLSFSDAEGEVLGMDMLGDSLVVHTSKNFIKVYDLSRREYKQVGVSRKFEDSSGSLGSISSVHINAEGNKIGIIPKSEDCRPENLNSFFIYDVDMDSYISFSLGSERRPMKISWDTSDNRFFCVISEFFKEDSENEGEEFDFLLKFKGKELSTFFVTSEHGIKRQDIYKLEEDAEDIFALSIPNYYLISKTPEGQYSYGIKKNLLKDFCGLDRIDEEIKTSIVNFSFYLAIGNMDEAYKAVKSIQNPIIWENMASMCVKSKRLDVAEICIGNMRFARGARAVILPILINLDSKR